MEKDVLDRVKQRIQGPYDLKVYYEAMALANTKPARLSRFEKLSRFLSSLDGLAKWLIGGLVAAGAITFLFVGLFKDSLSVLETSKDALVKIQGETATQLEAVSTQLEAVKVELSKTQASANLAAGELILSKNGLRAAKAELANSLIKLRDNMIEQGVTEYRTRQLVAVANEAVAKARFFGTIWRTGEDHNGFGSGVREGMPLLRALAWNLPDDRCHRNLDPDNLRVFLANNTLFWQLTMRKGSLRETCTGLGVWRFENRQLVVELCDVTILKKEGKCPSQPIGVLRGVDSGSSNAPPELQFRSTVGGTSVGQFRFRNVIDAFW